MLQSLLKSIFIIVLTSNYVSAQFILKVNDNNCWNTKLIKIHQDPVSYINQQLDSIRTQGYWGASIDSLIMEDTIKVNIYCGPKLDKVNIEWKINDSINEVDLPKQLKYNTAINSKLYSIYKEFANLGYPKTELITDLNIGSSKVFISVIPYNKVFFLPIEHTNQKLIANVFLARYLDINNGDPFSLSKVESIEPQISKLRYLKLSNPPKLLIANQYATVVLNLKKVASNRFDFLLGLLPQANGRLFVFGELTADLQNSLRNGESIYLQAKRVNIMSQKLLAKATFPYPFGFPFGVQSTFSLLKNSSTSVDLKAEIGFDYLSSTYNITTKYHFSSSRLLDIDTLELFNSQTLPKQLDFRTHGIGVEWNWQNYISQNPRKGHAINWQLQLGNRETIPNNRILNLKSNDLSFEYAYDTISLQSIQFQSKVLVQKYFALNKYSSLLLRSSSGLILSSDKIYQNEYYRLGGINSLRGFNEETILSNLFSIITSEYRYYLIEASFLRTFLEGAFVQNEYNTTSSRFLYALGLGMNLKTDTGMLGVDFAIGNKSNETINFRSIKTHIKYISIF